MADISKIKIGTTDYTIKDSNALRGVASSSNLGGIKLGFTQSGKNYPVVVNSSNQAYVNVPWEGGGSSTDTKNTAGSTASSSKLYLIGATEQSANPVTYSNASVYATNGALTASSFNVGSLRKLKDDIKKMDFSALDIINDTEIVTFVFKSDKTKEPRIGFIADDSSSWISTREHNSMDIYNCIGVLMKAVQELSEEVERLKKNG